MRAIQEQNAFIMEARELNRLIETLAEKGYETIGPTVQQGAILYGHVGSAGDLPAGWSDQQGPGTYRVSENGDSSFFGYVVGPNSGKSFLHPSRETLMQASRKGDLLEFVDDPAPPERYALIGLRPCDVKAIEIQDRVLLEGLYVDRKYKERRDLLFIVTVNCAKPGGTCFCTSMGSGPAADSGYDLALTELNDDRGHRFLVEVGSDSGSELVAALTTKQATAADIDSAGRQADDAAEAISKSIDTTGLREQLYDSLDSPYWEKIGARCLACTNCTMVCPTCFCTNVQDVSDLAGNSAERIQIWDSCFNAEFSGLHGGSVRQSIHSRYRQWMTHKLASWEDQFDTLGCVGCGRCITWCPVGIDITEEANTIRKRAGQLAGTVEDAP